MSLSSHGNITIRKTADDFLNSRFVFDDLEE